MMLLCPKCGDYYADDSLAFCLADGAPLVSVDAISERWTEGSRIIEQKENALRKKKRRLKWRRVSSVMTMLIITMVVYGVVAKRYVYLVPAASPSPTPASPPSPSPSESLSATPSLSPSPSPPSPSPSPSPAIVIKETPTPTIVIKETPTPTIVISETPTPTIVIKETPTPTVVIKQTPTPKPTPTPGPPPVIFGIPTPTSAATACSAADERRDEQAIRNYSSAWKKNIEGERAKIIKEHGPAGVGEVESSLGNIELQINFVTPCSTAVVMASYAWKLSYSLTPTTRTIKTVSMRRTIPCRKVFGKWVCG